MKQLVIQNKIFIFLFLMIISAACSSSKESTSNNNDENEVYVFDDVTDMDTTSHEAIEVTVEQKVESSSYTSPAEAEEKYIVQVGAFSTREKAENFLKEMKNKLNYQLNILPSEKVGLFVVQLTPFSTRGEAEKVRNELWNMTQFGDAFIVP